MRIILRTMDLPDKSAALYRPRKSPIVFNPTIRTAIIFHYILLQEYLSLCLLSPCEQKYSPNDAPTRLHPQVLHSYFLYHRNPVTANDMWPEFTIPELRYKELNVNMATGRALKSNQCHFWNTYLMQLQTMLGKMF